MGNVIGALLHSLTAVTVLVAVASVGFITSKKGWYDDKGRKLIAALVNLCIPFFLFYTVTNKFTHDELVALLKVAALPFLTVGINWLTSWLIVKAGWVRKEIFGAFIACFTGSTVLFVGVPVTMAMFGEKAIAYLLVYFFANVVFIWTVGLYNLQLDGVRLSGRVAPKLISAKSIRMLFSPPFIGFLCGVAFVVFGLAVPKPLMMITGDIGKIASPLALIFIGMTIQRTGFEKLRHMPREVCFILGSCFVLRPLVMFVLTGFVEMDPLMRRVFVMGSALPVSSVIGVLAKNYGADEEFCSEAIGMSTIVFIFVIPVVLTLVNMM